MMSNNLIGDVMSYKQVVVFCAFTLKQSNLRILAIIFGMIDYKQTFSIYKTINLEMLYLFSFIVNPIFVGKNLLSGNFYSYLTYKF